jgi:hypothetical protein
MTCQPPGKKIPRIFFRGKMVSIIDFGFSIYTLESCQALYSDTSVQHLSHLDTIQDQNQFDA